MTKKRRTEHRIEIEAPAEAVWKALVDAQEIVRWYAPEAEVEPGEGGRYRVSWGEGMEAVCRIAEWKPGERLTLQLEVGEPLLQEFTIESRGGKTILRLVQSNVPDSPDWDDFYEDTDRGWKMFLAGLRHYLERHLGEERASIMFMQPVGVPVDEAWRKLIGPDGLAAEGSLAGATVGERRTVKTAFGQELEVQVLVHEPPRTLSMTVDNLADSLLALDFERIGGKTFLYANLSTFGVPESAREALRRDWSAWIERLFPAAPSAPPS